MAKRMNARTIEVKASHLSLISHPGEAGTCTARKEQGAMKRFGSAAEAEIADTTYDLTMGGKVIYAGSSEQCPARAFQCPKILRPLRDNRQAFLATSRPSERVQRADSRIKA